MKFPNNGMDKVRRALMFSSHVQVPELIISSSDLHFNEMVSLLVRNAVDRYGDEDGIRTELARSGLLNAG